jgi:hypothetical protein
MVSFRSASTTKMLTQTTITPELVRGDRQMTDAEVAYKTGTAHHEAAHLVAACACPGSGIANVRVHPTGRRSTSYRGPNAGAAGTVGSSEVYEDETLFVFLVGYYWEVNYGEPKRAEDDFQRGNKSGYEYVRNQADAFVVANEELIRQVAVGLLALATKDGTLKGEKLDKLVAWTRARVTKYQSKAAPPKRIGRDA